MRWDIPYPKATIKYFVYLVNIKDLNWQEKLTSLMNEKKKDPQSTKKVLKCIGNKHDKTQDEKNA